MIQNTNRFYEENISAALYSIVSGTDYPHHSLRILLTVVQKDKNLYSSLLNSCLFALLVNGVKLKGSCFCLEFGKSDSRLELYQNNSD